MNGDEGMKKGKFLIPMALSSTLFIIPLLLTTPAHAIQQGHHHQLSAKGWNNTSSGNPHKSIFATELAKQKYSKKDAIQFIEQNNTLLKMNKPSKNLTVNKEETDSLGMKHVKLQQTYKGLPVEGTEVRVHYNQNGEVQTVNGQYNNQLTEKVIDTSTKITEIEALKIAKASVDAPSKLNYQPTTELVLYSFEQKDYVAYKVNLTFLGNQPGNWFVFIDARTGQLIDQYNALMHTGEYKASKGMGLGVKGNHRTLNISHRNIPNSKQGTQFYLYDISKPNTEEIKTFDFKNQWDSRDIQLPGELISSKDAAFTDDYERAGVDAHYNSEKVYQYFLKEHNRNSIDGKGMAIISSVHYGENYNNAFWDGYQMTYGDGDGSYMVSLSAGLDVAAHEMTHGVTTTSSNLKYRFESGALNEAFSDIFGALIDEDDWELGEDIMGEEAQSTGRTSLRSLSNPSKYSVNAAYVPYGNGSGKYPKHMSEFYDLPMRLNNGGVHINSSIINHAAYLTGTQIGKEKLGKIYYRALTLYLTPDSNFLDARHALLQSATDLYGASSSEYTATEDGLKRVGIIE